MTNPASLPSRRHCLQAGLGLAGLCLATPLLGACGGKKKELACTDTSGLSGPELQMRTQLKYVDRSPDAQKNCTNCQFYQSAPSANQCGGCTLVKGPIHPRGYCVSWAAKQG